MPASKGEYFNEKLAVMVDLIFAGVTFNASIMSSCKHYLKQIRLPTWLEMSSLFFLSYIKIYICILQL